MEIDKHHLSNLLDIDIRQLWDDTIETNDMNMVDNQRHMYSVDNL